MEWWLWLVVIGVIGFLIADWFIVMGWNPKRWKGGERDDHSERPDR